VDPVRNLPRTTADGPALPCLVGGYWHNIDKTIGDRIEHGMHAKQTEQDPKADQQANSARSSMQAKA
jgi:hypothetical protein